MHKNQGNSVDKLCCVNYCETTFSSTQGEIINSYQCNQKSMTSVDMWEIQRQKKGLNIGAEQLIVAAIAQA